MNQLTFNEVMIYIYIYIYISEVLCEYNYLKKSCEKKDTALEYMLHVKNVHKSFVFMSNLVINVF